MARWLHNELCASALREKTLHKDRECRDITSSLLETLLRALLVALRAFINERLSLVASILQQLLPLFLEPLDLLCPLLFFFFY